MATRQQVIKFHPYFAGVNIDAPGYGYNAYGLENVWGELSDAGKPYGITYWGENNPVPQPTEAELDALKAETDPLVLQDRREEFGRVLLTRNGDHLITALDILVDAVDELQSLLKPEAIVSPLTETGRVDTLRNRINQLKTRIQNEA